MASAPHGQLLTVFVLSLASRTKWGGGQGFKAPQVDRFVAARAIPMGVVVQAAARFQHVLQLLRSMPRLDVVHHGQGLHGGPWLEQAMLDAARPYLLRILGPKCIGALVTGVSLNASFAPGNAKAGRLAFVTQSGALATAMLDWAGSRGIGFSHFISLGDSADVDFGDVLDYLASDAQTRAILIYAESFKVARKFMSAARAAARHKPVIVVKAGRAPDGARAAASHTGALAGSDAVIDAAIRRAGMLRVDTLESLFDAAETLAHVRPWRGDRLAILTNNFGGRCIDADQRLNGMARAECGRGAGSVR